MTDWTTARVTPETLAELRRLLDAATPGPWRDEMMQGDRVTLTAIVAGKPNPDDLRVVGSTLAHNDARVLIAAVNALPALLDAAAERDALAADADKWQRAALTLQRDRDALTDERDSLSWQAEAIRADELRRHEAGLDADLAYQAFAGEEALR